MLGATLVPRFPVFLGFFGDSEPLREDPERKSISSSLDSASELNRIATPLLDEPGFFNGRREVEAALVWEDLLPKEVSKSSKVAPVGRGDFGRCERRVAEDASVSRVVPLLFIRCIMDSMESSAHKHTVNSRE